MMGPYDDLLYLPHPVSRVHPQMPMEERAAQFSPFAALSGYGDVIRETARLTVQRPELEEDSREELDQKLRRLAGKISQRPEVFVTYYLADSRKEGGTCVTASGRLKGVDSAFRELLFADGTRIPVEDIVEIRTAGKFAEPE